MPRYTEWNDELAEALAAPFPDEAIGALEKGGEVIPYIPHHQITKRLNELVGPDGWEEGEPEITVVNGRLILGGPLTILGVQRYNFGDESVSVGEEYEDEYGKRRTRGYSSAIMSARAQWLRRSAAGFGLGAYLYEDDHPARKAAERVALALKGKIACPECGGPVWDNREKKANEPDWSGAPDFRCKESGCKHEFNLSATHGTVPSDPPDPREKQGHVQPSETKNDEDESPGYAAYDEQVGANLMNKEARRVFWIGNPDLPTKKSKRTDADYARAAEQLEKFGSRIIDRARANAIERVFNFMDALDVPEDRREELELSMNGEPSDAEILDALKYLWSLSQSEAA